MPSESKSTGHDPDATDRSSTGARPPQPLSTTKLEVGEVI
jgi:hypothetical protein